MGLVGVSGVLGHYGDSFAVLGGLGAVLGGEWRPVKVWGLPSAFCGDWCGDCLPVLFVPFTSYSFLYHIYYIKNIKEHKK